MMGTTKLVSVFKKPVSPDDVADKIDTGAVIFGAGSCRHVLSPKPI